MGRWKSIRGVAGLCPAPAAVFDRATKGGRLPAPPEAGGCVPSFWFPTTGKKGLFKWAAGGSGHHLPFAHLQLLACVVVTAKTARFSLGGRG